MATSSKDIETLWQRYSEEGSKNGISVRDFFEKNGVPYHVFEKWYKRKYQHPEIVDCKVTGSPDIEEEQPEKEPCNGDAPKSKAVSYICITFMGVGKCTIGVILFFGCGTLLMSVVYILGQKYFPRTTKLFDGTL